MKNIKRFLVILLAAFVLVGCSNKSGGGSSDIVEEPAEGTVVTFWHAMNRGQEEALVELTEKFNAENPGITVKLENQSSYPDMQAKINATMSSPKDFPTITQAYPNWLWNAAQDELLVDLGPYVNHAKLGIENIEDINPSFMDGAKINDVQYGIPFNKSTEVLFYNKDLLTQYGVEVPTTMEELAAASKTIFEKSNGAVVGAGFDSLNNYYAIGMENKGVDFNKELDITSPESVEIMKYYQDGIKEGYFRIAGSDKYLSGPFGNQLIAMNIGSMAGETHVREAAEGNFEYGVAVRPSEINIQQGTDIYMFQNATADERTAAFMYMNFLTTPESQLLWATKTGYMPVRTSVQNDEAYKNSGSLVAPIMSDATKQLFSIPVIENSDPAYSLAREFVEKIMADPTTDPVKVLEEYKPLMESAWNQ